jgi:very-short-patch-repair endonuclease
MRYGNLMAAVLVSGDDAVASHRAAAWLQGLRGPPAGLIDVTVPRAGGRRRRGIALHVTRLLPSNEVTEEEGMPCTTPMRTLVDLAAVSKYERELRRALERSLELNIFDRIALDAVLERSSGRRGTGMLRRVLTDLSDEPLPIDSELERRFLELVRAAGLPDPVVNGQIGLLRVDFYWPDHKLVVETDGQAVHSHGIAFRRDRDRDLALTLEGWHVIRLSWRQVVDEPERIAATLRRHLRPR